MMRRSHALRKRAAFDWVTILSLKRIELQLSLHKATIQPLGNLSFLEERRRVPAFFYMCRTSFILLR